MFINFNYVKANIETLNSTVVHLNNVSINKIYVRL